MIPRNVVGIGYVCWHRLKCGNQHALAGHSCEKLPHGHCAGPRYLARKRSDLPRSAGVRYPQLKQWVVLIHEAYLAAVQGENRREIVEGGNGHQPTSGLLEHNRPVTPSAQTICVMPSAQKTRLLSS